MARISISQIMLVLSQGEEIPVLKRALPVFEEILAKKDLYLVPPKILGQMTAQSQAQGNSMTDVNGSSHTQVTVTSSDVETHDNSPLFDADFLGFDFLDEWQCGQMDFIG
jgi:phage gp45-like